MKGSSRAVWWPWVETVALAAAVPLLGSWLRPVDPFFLEAPFCWPVLVVLLLSLQHGVAQGLGATVALGLGMTLVPGTGEAPALPVETCLGLLVAAVVAGEFHGCWHRRLARAERQSGEDRARLERLSREWHLLRVSHTGLEERLAGGAPSLLQVLSQLEVPPEGEVPARAMGELLLGLVSSHCGVQVAALHVLENGRWVEEPLAVLGAGGVHAEEPLVCEALRTRRLVSACSYSRSGGDSRVLVALPLVDEGGLVRGVLTISEMQFISFQEDTLRLLAVLGRHVGELLARAATQARTRPELWSSPFGERLVEPSASRRAERPRPLPEVL